MSHGPEAKLKTKIRKFLQSIDCYYFTPVGSTYGKNGVPDIIVLLDGTMCGVEVKSGKGKVTALQKYNLEQIEQHGGCGYLVNEDNFELFKRVISTGAYKDEPLKIWRTM